MTKPAHHIHLLYGHTEFVRGWVRERIAVMREADFGPSTALGVMSGQRLIAGVVFHDWNPIFRSIQVSCAAESARWSMRSIVSEILSYPFNQLGVNRIVAVTESANERTRKFLEGIGMTFEGTGLDGFGEGNDAASYRLLRREWEAGRFHVKDRNHGQKGQSTKAA